MVITKIKYEKLFPVGAYLNEKIGFEADLLIGTNIDTKQRTNDLEDPLEAIEKLRELAEKSHKEKYPHLYTESGSPVTIEQKDPVDRTNEYSQKSTVERTIDQINQCSDIKVLESFRLLAKNNPQLQEAYDNKLKTFQ